MALRMRRLRLRFSPEWYREWRLKRAMAYLGADIIDKMTLGPRGEMPKFDGLADVDFETGLTGYEGVTREAAERVRCRSMRDDTP